MNKHCIFRLGCTTIFFSVICYTAATSAAWFDEKLVVANPRGLVGLSSQADQHVAENRRAVEDYDVVGV